MEQESSNQMGMTASQRTKYTKRRAQIWEALHPVEHSLEQRYGEITNEPQRKYPNNLEVESVVPPQVATHGGARPQTKGFAASTAQATGMTKQAINRHLARADALGDTTLDKITGTSLDTGVEMDALAIEVEKRYAELAKRRQVEAGKNYGRGMEKVPVILPEAIEPQPAPPFELTIQEQAQPVKNRENEAREQAAKATGASPRYVQDAKAIARDANE